VWKGYGSFFLSVKGYRKHIEITFFHLEGLEQAKKLEEIFSEWVQFDEGPGCSVNQGSNSNTQADSMVRDKDNMTSLDEFTGTTKKQLRQPKKCIKINRDIVQFISKRNKYSQELSERLEMLSGEVELLPGKSLIIVTKKLRSRYIEDWHNQCGSTVTTFCNRFKKNCFELKELSSVRKALPELRKILQWSSAVYWIESNKRLAVMTEQNECEQVLKEVRKFLGNHGKDGTDSYGGLIT
jgi:hypothetical protein